MELFANPWFLVYFLPAALLAWLVAWSGKKLKKPPDFCLIRPAGLCQINR